MVRKVGRGTQYSIFVSNTNMIDVRSSSSRSSVETMVDVRTQKKIGGECRYFGNGERWVDNEDPLRRSQTKC